MAVDPFEKWLSNPPRGSMTWVVAGRSRSGKSTLVENLLGLKCLVPSSDTNLKAINIYNHKAGDPGVDLTIVEIPGLDSSGEDQNQSIITNELQSATQGEADALLYCVSVAPSSRLGDMDREIVNLLTYVFKARIWERAVLVLTFADYVKDRHAKAANNPALKNVLDDYAKTFGEILEAANIESSTVVCLHRLQGDNKLIPPQEIPAVPAGETPHIKLLPDMMWEEQLYSKMLTKCALKAIPMLLNIGKHRVLKSNPLFQALWFGVAAAVITRLIAFSYFKEPSLYSPTGVFLGIVVGGTVALLTGRFGTDVSTWASSARSIAKARFQQDPAARS